MALTKKGSLAFGIGAGGMADPVVSGISNTTSIEANSEYTVNVSAKDPAGETVCHVYGDQKNSMRVEGYTTAASLPSLGSTLTIAGKSCAVMGSSVQASNEDFVKVNVSAEGFNALSY